jgi:membrane-bound inhibitor of C-type lysozyme
MKSNTMRNSLVTAWLVASMVACTAADRSQAGAGEAASVGEPTGERRAQFSCDDGNTIEMRFFPLQGVGVLVRDGATMELQQQVSASGFVYSNGPTTVRGKGDELRLEIGRRVPIVCQAAE